MIYHWVEEFTDEIVPCAPTLDAWAAWMADPAEGDWFGRTLGEPIADRTVFEVSPIELLGVITVTVDDAGDYQHAAPPSAANAYVQMTGNSWEAERR